MFAEREKLQNKSYKIKSYKKAQKNKNSEK
jgi:hypothetical protein